jgi:hypothetical protein
MSWVPPSGGGYGEQPQGEPGGHAAPGSGVPGQGHPGYGSPSYPSPGHPSPGHPAPGYGTPNYPAPGYGAPPPGGPGYGVPGPGAPGGPPAAMSERERRADRALRALPPPPHPPPGMGAVPAFAPPVPRPNRTALIVSLVLGATLLLCCGGGVTGIGGLFYYFTDVVKKDAVAAVDGYLSDLSSGEFQSAYSRLCVDARTARSIDRFTAEEQRAQVLRYRVKPEIRSQDGALVVTADVTRGSGVTRSESFPVIYDDANSARVCPR